MIAGAIEWILDLQQRLLAREMIQGGKKCAHRRDQDAVLALSKGLVSHLPRESGMAHRRPEGAAPTSPGGNPGSA